MKEPVLLAASVAAVLLASTLGHAAPAFRSGVFDPPRAAPDFTLAGSNGAPVKLGQYKGKVVALAFGFTYCQKVCPVTLAKLAEVFKQLGPAGKDLQVVFVSVDPERDTPERMREFLGFFGPRFMGATGSQEALDAARDAYGILATKVKSEDKRLGYEVHHSSSVHLIDRQGRLRLLFPFGKPADDLRHDVELLLKE
jgi:protein SCO1/2